MTVQVMLASKVTDFSKLVYPLYASPKLDGIRAVVVDGVVMSRKMKPIPNAYVQKLFGHSELNGLDGELIVGRSTAKDCYTETMSGVMSLGGTPDATFWVFDDYLAQGGFRARLAAVNKKITKLRFAHVTSSIRPVPHSEIRTQEAMTIFEFGMLEAGYEGVCMRALDGPYKHGRSTAREGWLLKCKRFQDGEAVVLGCEELQRNTNARETDALGHAKRSSAKAGQQAAGMLGALRVRDCKTKVEFSVGTGFDEDFRRSAWVVRDQLIGKVIKYKSFNVGAKDLPRHPVFLGFRSAIDF